MSKTTSSSAKFHRTRDQRGALLKSLSESLIINGSIETTVPKAKAVARYTERLIGLSLRGKGSLSTRRQIISRLPSAETAHRLIDEVAPKFSGRPGGYTRVKRTISRSGDGAQLARVSFVEEVKTKKTAQPESPKIAKDGSQKTQVDAKPQASAKSEQNTKVVASKRSGQAQVSKRTGIRGNR